LRAARSDNGDAGGLRALRALADLKLHALVLLERLEAAASDGERSKLDWLFIRNHPNITDLRFLSRTRNVSLVALDSVAEVEDFSTLANLTNLNQLPETLRPEVTAWVRVLRGEGRKPSRCRDWSLIRRYLMPLMPILQRWSAHTDTLRSITTDDIETELKQLAGHASYTHVALRSLFRALKRERSSSTTRPVG